MLTLEHSERTRLQQIKDLKERLEEAKYELEVAQRQGQYEKASRLRFSTIPELEKQLPKENEPREEEGEGALSMLHDRVTSNDISRVVAKATGIPVQNLLKGEREKLVHVRLSTASVKRTEQHLMLLSRWKMRSANELLAKTTSCLRSVTQSVSRGPDFKHQIDQSLHSCSWVLRVLER